MGDRLMVGLSPLKAAVKVRILLSQIKNLAHFRAEFFIFVWIGFEHEGGRGNSCFPAWGDLTSRGEEDQRAEALWSAAAGEHSNPSLPENKLKKYHRQWSDFSFFT